jgi:Zinc dependent phospholipase C
VPPIFLHMATARDVRRQLADGLAGQEGAYYLGATSPDIRVLTRWERERTHFFDLNDTEHQDSVAAMLEAYPDLADAARLNRESAAFVAGYLTHLTLDETWITQVYRPHFGQLSALGGGAQANVMDRVLQYELDRRRREDVEGAAEIRAALEGCSLAIDVGFLDSETLRRWLEVAIDMTRHPPTWERFRFQGGRHLKTAGVDSEDALSEFMQRVPEVLEQTLRHVSTAHVDAYLEQSKERALIAAERYLGER